MYGMPKQYLLSAVLKSVAGPTREIKSAVEDLEEYQALPQTIPFGDVASVTADIGAFIAPMLVQVESVENACKRRLRSSYGPQALRGTDTVKTVRVNADTLLSLLNITDPE